MNLHRARLRPLGSAAPVFLAVRLVNICLGLALAQAARLVLRARLSQAVLEINIWLVSALAVLIRIAHHAIQHVLVVLEEAPINVPPAQLVRFCVA